MDAKDHWSASHQWHQQLWSIYVKDPSCNLPPWPSLTAIGTSSLGIGDSHTWAISHNHTCISIVNLSVFEFLNIFNSSLILISIETYYFNMNSIVIENYWNYQYLCVFLSVHWGSVVPRSLTSCLVKTIHVPICPCMKSLWNMRVHWVPLNLSHFWTSCNYCYISYINGKLCGSSVIRRLESDYRKSRYLWW